jgi:pilus assembly protein CpaB
MNVKKALPLGIALILGLISARMMVQIMHGRNAAAVANGPKLAKVVVARQDIGAGDPLTDDDLTTTQIVADSVPNGAFNDPSAVIGRVSSSTLAQGQTILESGLAPKGSGTGLQAVIPVGMRAVTIDINETSGVAGYVSAGCRVDLIQSVRDETNKQLIGRCIAQNVLVTAVGTRPMPGDAQQPAHSVTLLLTPRQAELIELATNTGRPRLVLRSARDQQIDDLEPVTVADLAGVNPAAPATITADPFAQAAVPTTQPEAAKAPPQWQMRVVNAGQPSVVGVRMPNATETVTGTDNESKDANAP